MIVAIYGSANVDPESAPYQAGIELGSLLAKEGHVVMTGGYTGIMEAVSRGAAESGGQTIGITCAEIDSWRPGGPNPWVLVEIPTSTLTARLDLLTRQPDAMIALQGGIGTLCEVALALNLMAIKSIPVKPLIVIGQEWKNSFMAFFSENYAYISNADKQRIQYAKDSKKAVLLLKKMM